MSVLTEQLQVIDMDFLAGLANAGIIKRASRELSDTKIELTFEGDTMTALFTDGITVTLAGTVNNYTCSCPSSSICRHVILAIMKGMEGASLEAGEPCYSPAQFSYLLEYTDKQLIKLFGSKNFYETMASIDTGSQAQIKEEAMITVTLPASAFMIKFLPNSSIEKSACTCKERICNHRLEALFYYIVKQNGTLGFEHIVRDKMLSADILPDLNKFTFSILKLGLSHLPSDYGSHSLYYATLCHGAGFADLEQRFKRVSSELELYYSKSAAFNKARLISEVININLACQTMLTDTTKITQLAGRFKNRYQQIPTVSLYGAGEYAWHTKTGYCGITIVFYCKELNRILTYTISRPLGVTTEVQTQILQMRQKESLWGAAEGISQLAQSCLTLYHGKISNEDRLSSAADSHAVIKGSTLLDSSMIIESGEALTALFTADIQDNRIKYCVMKINAMIAGSFDEATQIYTAEIEAFNGKTIYLKITYSNINKVIIQNFELMLKYNITPQALTVSLFLSAEERDVVIFPIAVWLGQIPEPAGQPLTMRLGV